MRRRDERGAVLVMAVLLMTVILTFTAFAVDLGTQRVARRDMQSLADAAAMDLARQLKGRTAQDITGDSAWARIKNEAITQNKTTVGKTPALTVALGTVDSTTGAFTAVSGAAVPTAVKVIAATSVGYAFVPGRGGAARTAVAATADPLTCFSVSPTALTVDTSGSALAPLLDQILRVKLHVLNSNGLLEVRGLQVPLADIAVELGAVTPQSLVNLSNVSLQDVVLASATALSKNGYTAQAAVLKAIGLQISGAYVNVGKILNLDTANAAGLAAYVNVFDLVTGAIFASNGTNSIDVNNLGLTVPGLAAASLTAKITEPPQIACGKVGTVAKSAQVKLQLTTKVADALGATDINLDLALDLGRGQGTLMTLTCAADGSGAATAMIRATTGAALVAGSTTPDAIITLTIAKWEKLPLGTLVALALKPLLGSSALAVKAQLGAAAVQGGPKDLTFTMPAGSSSTASQQVSADSNVITLALKPGGTTVTLLSGSLLGTLLGSLLDPLLDAVVTGVVKPLVDGPVNTLLSTLLFPVLNLLGIKVAQTDVAVHGKADCTTVKLVG